MQGLKISSFDRTNTETMLLSNFSRATDAGQIVLVRAVLGRHLGGLCSFGNTQCSCCVLWEVGSTCHRVPLEGVISGRC